MNGTEIKKKLNSVLKELKAHGYKCYNTTKGEWGYIITPSDNVLNIYRAPYNMGWSMSLAYVQSAKNGTGCMCLEDPVTDVTLGVIQQAEEEGLAFARRLGAQLYRNSDTWLKNYWAKDSLQKV